MKRIYTILTAALCIFGAQSCLEKDSKPVTYYQSIVTVKPTADGEKFAFTVNDTLNIIPTNIAKSPFKGECRAIAIFRPENEPIVKGDNMVILSRLDSISTKNIAENFGDKNVEKYGNDKIDIVNSPDTEAEDGYFTFHLRTWWGYGAVKHDINLVQDTDNPLKFTLFHNANRDVAINQMDALAAFRLPELPGDKGDKVKITISWLSTEGEKTKDFDYVLK